MLLGESDVDAIIADRLSGQAPFMSVDLLWPPEPSVEPAPETTPKPAEAPTPEPVAQAAPEETPPAPAQRPEPVVRKTAPLPSQKAGASSHAIDMSGMFDENGREDETLPGRSESQEVDLSDVLIGLNSPQATVTSAPQPFSIESVLKAVRDEVVHDAASPEVAEQHLNLATTYIEMGMTENEMKALEVATRSPRHRFRAGALLAKLYLDKGAKAQAIEWFERAADPPAPSPAAAHQLLYELATALEAEGETSRALAVFLKLQAEAGEYRALAARLEHLTKVQIGS